MNQFAHVSRFEITASRSTSGNTFIEDSFFTSPFKIMKPFAQDDGSIAVFLQSASPGILEDDSQIHKIKVNMGAGLEIRSQSFEKIFKMDEGKSAARKIIAEVEKDATLIYRPLPCIPFSQSNFSSTTEINLKENSRLIYEDCICAGRIAHGEVFDFTRYKNLIKIYREGHLIYRDNLFLEGSNGNTHPERKALLQGKTMFSNYTHCGSMLIFGYSEFTNLKTLRAALGLEEKLLYTEQVPSTDTTVDVSENDHGDFIIRCLANSAEKIQKLFELVRNNLK